MNNKATELAFVNYPQLGKDVAVSAPAKHQLQVYSVRAMNRSGGTANIGIVRKFADGSLKLFSYDGSLYTEISLPLTAATPIIDTTIGHGFVVQTKTKSGFIGFEVSTAGGGGAYLFEYWNGSAWVAMNTIANPDLASTGTTPLVFAWPLDWVAGGDGDLDATMYAVRVTSGTAPGSDIEVSSIWAGQLLEFVEGIVDNSSVQVRFEAIRPLLLDGNEGIMPYFASPSVDNTVTVEHSNI